MNAVSARAVLLHFVTQASDPNDSDDLVSGVGNEIRVGLDRWSSGHVGVTDLVIAGAIVVIGGLLAWVASRIARRIARRNTGATHTAVAVAGIIASSMFVLLAASISLEVLGFGLGPILVLILVVVIVLLLLRPMVTNLTSGLLLQVRGALEEGDLIKTNGVEGVIEEINARSVVIETNDGRRVHVPNTEVLDGTIENYTSIGRRRSTVEFIIDARNELDPVIAAVGRSLQETDHVLSEPPPLVLIDRLVASSVVMRCDVWHEPSLADARLARHETIGCVLETLDEFRVAVGGSALVTLGDDGPNGVGGKQ
jgi:small-conductance mechanosensitive channel